VPQFLEVNPLAGLHPTHSDLPILATLAGMPYQQLIGEILQAAKLRTGLVQPRRRRRLSA
jgi:D-alanine-D-alanine ligase